MQKANDTMSLVEHNQLIDNHNKFHKKELSRRDARIAELVEFIEDLKYRHNMMSQHQLNKLIEEKVAKNKGKET